MVFNGSTSAFQAERPGSNPGIRSIRGSKMTEKEEIKLAVEEHGMDFAEFISWEDIKDTEISKGLKKVQSVWTDFLDILGIEMV